MENQNTLPAVQEQHQPFARMLSAGHGINAGAVAIEQERAIAEAQGQLTLAKRFPRSMAAAITDFLEACNSPDFAATAFYSVPNRGSGPSIRLAEEAARCYGNFVYGHRELSRSEGKSEIEVYAWDMEKNNRSSRQITVMHIMDTKNGPRKLVDQADIDNKIANVASKQMRGRILALMPKHMIASGVAACKVTLAGGGERPLSDRIVAMVQAFARFGVTKDHLTAHLGHGVDNTTVDELADLMGIFNAIKEGAKASEYFNLDATESTAAAITNLGRAATAKVAAKQPADTGEAQDPQKGKTTESAAKKVKEPEPEFTQTDQARAVSQKPAPVKREPQPEAGQEDDVF